ncbi:energy transducer TonB [Flavobacterium pectinovorum]|uniref:energy transducer TonB n=1 Tax=Flavobacterium pectinovorum TaxID=29533 RepID=UPI001FAC9B23|nr:energy transducer TonB [Flavobacterium pectinovorum]MCI9845149.1 TonB family protein [Flavobacterium pectinovorum]
MKTTVRLLLFLISIKLFSQNPVAASKLIYLDSLWAETTADNYKYTRLIEAYFSNKEKYVFKEYYKSFAIKSIGTTLNKDIIKKDGQFLTYYENGNKKSIQNYSDGKKIGKEYNWYENGNIKSELEYSQNKKGEEEWKINNYWTAQKEQKVTNGDGDYEIVTEHQQESGKVKNGFPEGIWKGKNLKSKTTFTETYENGKLVSGISKDSLNIEYPYTVLDQRPSPKKGMSSFYSYVGKSLYIPVEARNKVSGKIHLTFIVDKDGSLIEPKILKGIGHGLDESAITVIKHAKKWNPGIRRGTPVRVLYSLPITIQTANKT